MILGQLTKPQQQFQYVGSAIDSSARVRQVIANLLRAVTANQVAATLIEGGMTSVDANSGAVVLLTDDRRALRLVHAVGRMAKAVHHERRFSLSTNFPLAEVVRSRQELWLTSPEALIAHYPDLEPEEGACSWAVLPLLVDSVVLGAVGWSFSKRGITADERAQLRTLSQAGGDAMYRAGLYDAERRARAEAEIARHNLANELASAEAERAKLLAAHAVFAAEADQDSRREELLALANDILDGVEDASEALQRVARVSLPHLGHWCEIDVLDDNNRLQRVGIAHVDPAKDRALRETERPNPSARPRLPRSLREGRPRVICSLTDGPTRAIGVPVRLLRSLRMVGLNRLMIVPLRIRGRTLGTLTFASEDLARTYSEADVALGMELGRRCAAAVEFSRLYDTAQQAAEAREEFVAATSHELRTPLSHIKGFVSTLRTTDTVWDRETHDDFLAEIEREADRLARLVENLLEMSRIDSGGLDKAARTPTYLNGLIAAGVDRVRGSLGEHPLEVQSPEDLPPVLVDGSQVERVIANLLENAAKYSPPCEPIGIIGRLAGDFVSVRIEDRGLGIPPEHVERIFEPFFREPTAGYPAKPGTGLGLAICRSIIRAQEGRIWAENRVGGGAAFVFTLPVAPPYRKV
jgi:signal transduction histidine kinase